MRARETPVIVFVAAVVAGVTTLVLSPTLPAAAAVGAGAGAAVVLIAIARRILGAGNTESGSIPLASLSHEIRTPLNAILGLTQLLLRMQPTTQQREYLESIKFSGQSLVRLINDILDYSKLRSGSLRFDPETFPLRKWVRETVRGLAPQAHLSGLELAFWVEPDVPDDVVGDPSRLRQVLVNLLGNAIKYTRTGDVSLAVSLVRRDADADAALLRFSVSDTGVGIPERERGRIFEAFAQGTETALAGDAAGGVGLGLAITKELVERMDGEVTVEPSPSGGSTFHFTARFELPPDGASGDDAAPTDPLFGFAVLVVDDSAAQRTALEKQMTSWGFSVTTASDEASTVEALERHGPFSFLLVDSHIPGVDVWALADKLQKLGPMPAVLMTLAHEHVDADVLASHGFHGYLTKPLAPTHLLRAIEIIRRGATVRAPEEVQTHDMDRLALGGIRVLLAEDHPVNRTVAVRMLERIGCEVTTATNGQNALEVLNSRRNTPDERFDIALVDVQMPEVDGLALARAIRAREAGTGEHLPLVAVTAHACAADRDRCLAAGMDAFLSKPFQEEELVSIMRGCLADASRCVAEARFDRPAALARANGDDGLLAELATLFIDETPDTLDAIEAALDVEDLKAVERLAHRLKGALATLSAERAAKLALSLETSARSQTPAACRDVLVRLEAELENLIPELAALTGSLRSS